MVPPMADGHSAAPLTPESIDSVPFEDETTVQAVSPIPHSKKTRKLERDPADEPFSQWLRRLHFRVFTDRVALSDNPKPKFLSASDADPAYLIDYFSWKFSLDPSALLLSKLDSVENIATSPNAFRPLLNALPTVNMETQILKELHRMVWKLPKQVIPVPKYWKDPEPVLYEGSGDQTQNRELREHNRKELVSMLETQPVAIQWTDPDFFKTIPRTAPNVTLNQHHFHDHFSTLHTALAAHPHDEPIKGELALEVIVGGKIAGLHKSPIATTSRGLGVPPPLPLGMFGSSAHPDVAMTMNLDWEINFAPLCFAGETKPSKNKSEKTPAQLAWCLHPSINMLILYHLHHRTSMEEPFPSWMYIYGVIQDENGIEIYAHYPRMVFGPEKDIALSNTPPPRYPHWGYGSLLVTTALQNSLKRGGKKRFNLLSALLTIQSHAHFLTRKFQDWKLAPNDMLELRKYAKRVVPSSPSPRRSLSPELPFVRLSQSPPPLPLLPLVLSPLPPPLSPLPPPLSPLSPPLPPPLSTYSSPLSPLSPPLPALPPPLSPLSLPPPFSLLSLPFSLLSAQWSLLSAPLTLLSAPLLLQPTTTPINSKKTPVNSKKRKRLQKSRPSKSESDEETS